jgi:hypothetical protein
MLVVYLQSGERKEFPKATMASIVGDRLLCLGRNGKMVAGFPSSDVYLCSKIAIPTIPA